MRKEFQFLKSAMTTENIFNSTEEIIEWVEERNREIKVSLDRVKLKELEGWQLEEKTQNISHKSGKFFSIEGINVNTNWRNIPNWYQPIINQPEIGFLGFLTKEFDGILYFLIQSKVEPGNVNNVQLSPTLQATKSNYTQVHGGKKPAYLEYFQDRENNEILLDQLQSEQGARFFRKRNRNIIIKVDSEVPLYDDFKWVTLGQIKELIGLDNKVNMDTRTVISGIPYGDFRDDTLNFYNIINSQNTFEKVNTQKMLFSELSGETALYTIDDIITWFTHLKTIYELDVTHCDLSKVKDWIITDYDVRHKDEKYFKVIGVHVQISNREVKKWYQPLVEPAQEGLCAFVIKEIKGVFHFLIQAKLECGNFDTLEFAPTVQCLTDNYKNKDSLYSLPFLKNVLSAGKDQIIFDTLQSEEGGRFYREQNRSMLILADDIDENDIPENYIWMTLNQIKSFIKFNNYLNIQARSLISAIKYN
jgi:oxidase EvaA